MRLGQGERPERLAGLHRRQPACALLVLPQVTTGYCDRMWTDSETAIAMSAAPSSSMTSVQPRYEKPAPPTASGNGAAGQAEGAHRREQRPVVALRLVALDGARGDLALGERARRRLEQTFLVGQRPTHGG